MKKFLFIFTALYCLMSVSIALAQINLGLDDAKNAAVKAGYSGATNQTTFAETLGTVVKAALSFVGVIFLALMVYAGFLWLNSRGEEADIDKAKEIIKAAIIGLIITVGAYSITAFVVPKILDRTAGPSGGDQQVGGQNPEGICIYTIENSPFNTTHSENAITQAECMANCPGPQGINSDCQFTVHSN